VLGNGGHWHPQGPDWRLFRWYDADWGRVGPVCVCPVGVLARAGAVHGANGVGAMSDDGVFKKCAWRLIPFMASLYLVNFIDRTNVGFAALTMNRDLGFSPEVFGFGAGIFFLS